MKKQMPKRKVKSNLKKCRLRAGLTQAEAAAAAGVTLGGYRKWECDNRLPIKGFREVVKERLSQAFNCQTSELWEDDNGNDHHEGTY